MSPVATKLLNVILYQAGWFCCVLGAAQDWPIIGALSALMLAGIHLSLSRSRKTEGLRMLGACLVGISVDSIQQGLGVFTFKTDPAWPLWLPLWVFVIWAQFATLFRYALHWLSGRYLLAAIFGMFGGPLAYWGGIKLGAASLGENPVFSIASLTIFWALLTPALFWMSNRLPDGEGEYRGFKETLN
jgi:Protein of unknown function (DUF2878)